MTLGQRLNIKLKENNLTQKELAKLLNVSTSTLNGYFTDYRTPDYDTLIKLCNVLNTHLDYLLLGSEQPISNTSTEFIELPTSLFNKLSEMALSKNIPVNELVNKLISEHIEDNN